MWITAKFPLQDCVQTNVLLYPRHTPRYAEEVYSFRQFRPSVRLSVFLSVRPSVRPSFRPSIHPSVNTCYNQVLLRSFLIVYISATTYYKLFILGMGVPGRVFFHSTSMDPWVMPRGGARGQNVGCLNKVVYCYNQILLRSFLIMCISLQSLSRNYSYLVWGYLRGSSSSTSMDPLVMPQGGARGQNLGRLNKVVYCSLFIQTTS